MEPRDAANRDLLFGLLALQNGMIDQSLLVAAFHAWTRDKTPTDRRDPRRSGSHRRRRSSPARRARHQASEAARRRRGEEPGACPAGASTRETSSRSATPTSTPRSAMLASGSTRDTSPTTATRPMPRPRAPPPRRRPAVPRPAAPRPGRAGGRLRRARRRAATARSRSSRSSTTTPTTRPAGTGSCSKPRSPAGSSIRGSSRSTAWAATATAGRTTPCGSSAATASRKRSPRFHADDIARGRSRPAVAGAAQAAAAVRRRLQRDRLRPHPRRPAPRHQAGQHHRRQARRDPGGRLGPGQGDGPSRRAGPTSDERTLVPSSASGSAETLPGSALGTPAYMSPEQAAGDLDRLGPQSTSTAWARRSTACSTGRPPFEGDDIGAVLRAVRHGRFPAARGSSTRRSTAALEAICLKAMALKPEDRYASCRALADDVERWTADEPVSAWREPLPCAGRPVDDAATAPG